MISRGRRRQGPKFIERLTIMVSTDLRRALENRAIEAERSMGEVARRILVEQLLTPAEEKPE